MDVFNTHEKFISALTQQIDSLYRKPAGALFTVGLAPVEGQGTRFFTGKVAFSDEPADARGSFPYPVLTLAEEWVPTADAAVQRLAAVLAGEAKVAGHVVQGRFSYTSFDRVVHDLSSWFSFWPGWLYTTQWDQQTPRPNVSYEPIAAFGLPPYTSGQVAVSEWIYGKPLTSGPAPFPHQLQIVLPDTRARISAAKWESGRAVVVVEANCDPDELELQAVYLGSKGKRCDVMRSPNGEVVLTPPEDAETVWLALVHVAGGQMTLGYLNQAYRSVGQPEEQLPLEQQVRRDMASGENEQVEYKPFVRPRDPKEHEIIETVIAFANTQGGRLLLGIDDYRNLVGQRQIAVALPPEQGGPAAEARLRNWANKLLTDKCKPIPHFTVHLLEIDGEPVGVIVVKRGDERPYSTLQNQVYVRKGSNNVIPDPKTEWQAFFGPVGVPGALSGDLL